MKLTARLLIESSILLATWIIVYFTLQLLLSDFVNPNGYIDIQIHDQRIEFTLAHLTFLGFCHSSIFVYLIRSIYTRFRSRSIGILLTLFSTLSIWASYSIGFVYHHAIVFMKLQALDRRIRETAPENLDSSLAQDIQTEIAAYQIEADFWISFLRICLFIATAIGIFASIRAILIKRKHSK